VIPSSLVVVFFIVDLLSLQVPKSWCQCQITKE